MKVGGGDLESEDRHPFLSPFLSGEKGGGVGRTDAPLPVPPAHRVLGALQARAVPREDRGDAYVE